MKIIVFLRKKYIYIVNHSHKLGRKYILIFIINRDKQFPLKMTHIKKKVFFLDYRMCFTV